MQLAHLLVEHLLEILDILSLACRDEQAVVGKLVHPGLLEFVKGDVLTGLRGEVILLLLYVCESINLVEDYHHRLVAAVKVGKSLLHNCNLLLELGMRHVYNVQQQVGLTHLVES